MARKVGHMQILELGQEMDRDACIRAQKSTIEGDNGVTRTSEETVPTEWCPDCKGYFAVSHAQPCEGI